MSDDFSISRTEEALIQALKSIVEITLIAVFETTFREQRDAMLLASNPEGVGVFEQLRKFVAHLGRQEDRERLAKLLKGSPAGQA